MNRLVYFLLLTCISTLSYTQSNYCGTQMTESDLVWLRNFQQNYTGPSEDFRGGTTYYVPLKVHIVGNDEGTGYYNLAYLYTAVCELNERYAETGFEFYIYGDLNYIDNSDYYEHDWYDGSDMMDENNVNDLVNIYFVADPAGNCGYFSPSDDGLAVAKSCAMPNGTTIAHEVGHFFSLPHTFYGWEWGTPDDDDQEWVSGINCNSAGDGFCDTPPDYLNYRWNCPGPEQTDPHGDSFYSDGSLYMSYSNDDCTNRFSEEQMDAMRSNLTGPRNDLLDYPDPVYVDITETPVQVEPANMATGIYPNYAVFNWTATPGATSYHLQIAYSTAFSAIAKDVITEDTEAIVTTLDVDKTYYWRVKPLAPLNTCEAYSSSRSFTTGTEYLTGTEESELFNFFAVHPNPVQSGNAMQMIYNSDKSFNGMLRLVDITGKLILEQDILVASGVNNLSLALPEIAEGIYMLQMSNGLTTEVKKIMVTQ